MVSRIFNWVSYQKQRINWVERLIRNGNNGHGIQNDRNSRSHTCKVFVLNIVWAYMSLCLVLSPCLYWAYTAENIRIDAIHTSIISITEHHLQEQNFLVVQHYGLHYTSTERDPQQSKETPNSLFSWKLTLFIWVQQSGSMHVETWWPLCPLNFSPRIPTYN